MNSASLTPNDLSVIRTCPLFRNLPDALLCRVLSENGTMIRTYEKNTVLFSQGQCIRKIGLILEGTVRIEQADYWGNRSILNLLHAGAVFGEAYAAGDPVPLDNDVFAHTKARILFLDLSGFLSGEESPEISLILLRNLLMITSSRSRFLAGKLSHIGKRTTRDRLLSYLSSQAQIHHSTSFEIPFSRQQLADYLSVDRCGLSTEIGKLQKEGLIQSSRNHFELFMDDSH